MSRSRKTVGLVSLGGRQKFAEVEVSNDEIRVYAIYPFSRKLQPWLTKSCDEVVSVERRRWRWPTLHRLFPLPAVELLFEDGTTLLVESRKAHDVLRWGLLVDGAPEADLPSRRGESN